MAKIGDFAVAGDHAEEFAGRRIAVASFVERQCQKDADTVGVRELPARSLEHGARLVQLAEPSQGASVLAETATQGVAREPEVKRTLIELSCSLLLPVSVIGPSEFEHEYRMIGVLSEEIVEVGDRWGHVLPVALLIAEPDRLFQFGRHLVHLRTVCGPNVGRDPEQLT